MQVAIAYGIQTGLGFLLACSCYILRRREQKPSWSSENGVARFLRRLSAPAERGFESFFTSAIYFSISILVASTYALGNKDYDIRADGFGILETQIANAVAVVTVLPLLYPITLGVEGKTSGGTDPNSADKADYNRRLHDRFRRLLYGLAVALFVYPFITQCIRNWAPSDVGEGKGPDGTTIANATEWATLSTMCLGDLETISDTERIVISLFELLGSSIFIVWAVCILLGSTERILRRRQAEKRPLNSLMKGFLAAADKVVKLFAFLSAYEPLIWGIVLLIPILISVPLLWGIFRLREVQRQLAQAITNVHVDDEWSFGQVVAILIYAPVLFDMALCAFEIN
jgi:hypothetical protein